MRANRLLGSAAAATISAVLFALGFPPWRWTTFSWLALAPLFVAVRSASTPWALFLGWLWCMVAAWATGDWLPRGVTDYFQQSLAIAFALFVGVFTLMAAPYVVAFVAVYRRLAVRFTPITLPFLTAAAWTAAELGRGRLFTGTPFFIGNPWALAGYAQAPNLALVQIASVTGIYGVSFAVACANAGLAEAWLAWRRDRRWRAALLPSALGALPALVVLGYGAAALSGPAPGHGEPAVTIGIVQGNLALGTGWRSDLYGKNLDTYLELTDGLADRGHPEIIFWPESALTFFLEGEPAYAGAIASLLKRRDVELIAGGPSRSGSDAAPVYRNSVYSLGTGGELRGRYDKEYLVPFAEYFPLEINVMRRRFGSVRRFSPGRNTAPLPTRAGPVGVLVCNEAMLPEVAAARVADGAVLIANPTNDTWISDPKYTGQQLDFARLRAIEQRRYLVRASTAGPSAVIDPNGRVQVQTRALAQDVALGEIRPVRERSIYGRVGDLFAALCVCVVLVALVVRRTAPRPATR